MTFLKSLFITFPYNIFTEYFYMKLIVFRFIWLPQLILSIFLLMSKILSIYCARKSKKADADNKYIFGDIFVLTTVDKLISIGRGAQDHFLVPDCAWPDVQGEE